MAIEAHTHNESSSDTANEPAAHNYDLDEQRWTALPDEAKVALGVAMLSAADCSFKVIKDLTEAIAAETDLNTEDIRMANIELARNQYYDRSGLSTDGDLKLALSEAGYRYIEEQLAKLP